MARKQDFPSLIRGDYFGHGFRIRRRIWDPKAHGRKGGGWVPGPYRDLSGWTGLFQLRTTYDGPKIADGTVTFLDQDVCKGGVFFSLDASDTEPLLGAYLYDFELTNELGQPKTYYTGTMTFGGDVSRA